MKSGTRSPIANYINTVSAMNASLTAIKEMKSQDTSLTTINEHLDKVIAKANILLAILENINFRGATLSVKELEDAYLLFRKHIKYFDQEYKALIECLENFMANKENTVSTAYQEYLTSKKEFDAANSEYLKIVDEIKKIRPVQETIKNQDETKKEKAPKGKKSDKNKPDPLFANLPIYLQTELTRTSGKRRDILNLLNARLLELNAELQIAEAEPERNTLARQLKINENKFNEISGNWIQAGAQITAARQQLHKCFIEFPILLSQQIAKLDPVLRTARLSTGQLFEEYNVVTGLKLSTGHSREADHTNPKIETNPEFRARKALIQSMVRKKLLKRDIELQTEDAYSIYNAGMVGCMVDDQKILLISMSGLIRYDEIKRLKEFFDDELKPGSESKIGEHVDEIRLVKEEGDTAEDVFGYNGPKLGLNKSSDPYRCSEPKLAAELHKIIEDCKKNNKRFENLGETHLRVTRGNPESVTDQLSCLSECKARMSTYREARNNQSFWRERTLSPPRTENSRKPIIESVVPTPRGPNLRGSKKQ